MMKNKLCRIAAAAIGVAALSLTASPGATAAVAEDDAPTFEEFQAGTFRDVGGQFVVNGDEVIADVEGLRAYYDRMVAARDTSQPTGLVINTVGGAVDKWSASQATNLTYCVSTRFGSNYDVLVAAMAEGAGLWEAESPGVDFTHVTSQDGNCRTSNNSVLFSVEPTRTTQYIARAFFPSSPDAQRNVLVNATSLQSSGSWTPGNILGHELGHTLGFRHEHTRLESGTCFEENIWRPLRPYDE